MHYVNDETHDFFEEILNMVPGVVKVKGLDLDAGTILRNQKPEDFVIWFNRWVSACLNKGIMVRTRSTETGKTCVWNEALSETAKVAKGYEALKGLI